MPNVYSILALYLIFFIKTNILRNYLDAQAGGMEGAASRNIIDTLLINSQRFILGPIKLVDNENWVFSVSFGQISGNQISGNNTAYNNFLNIPFFHKFKMSEGSERLLIRNFAPKQLPDGIDSNKVHMFIMNDQSYTLIMGIVKFFGVVILFYIIYRIVRLTSSIVRRGFDKLGTLDKEKYSNDLEKRIKKLSEEQKKLQELKKSIDLLRLQESLPDSDTDSKKFSDNGCKPDR